jgi:hypothetical protein
LQAIAVKKGAAAVSWSNKDALLPKAVTGLSLGSGVRGNNYIFAATGRTITVRIGQRARRRQQRGAGGGGGHFQRWACSFWHYRCW